MLGPQVRQSPTGKQLQAPTDRVLPYDILYTILADVIGRYIHSCMFVEISLEDIPHNISDLDGWDAIQTLWNVSRVFRDITCRLGVLAFGIVLPEKYASAPANELMRGILVEKKGIDYGGTTDSTTTNTYSSPLLQLHAICLDVMAIRSSQIFGLVGKEVLEKLSALLHEALLLCNREVTPQQLSQSLRKSLFRELKAIEMDCTVCDVYWQLFTIFGEAHSLDNSPTQSSRRILSLQDSAISQLSRLENCEAVPGICYRPSILYPRILGMFDQAPSLRDRQDIRDILQRLQTAASLQ